MQQLFVDANFVIVQAVALIDDKYDRKIWLFSKRATTYTNAFGAFEAPATSTSIIIYEGNERSLYLIRDYESLSVKINLPSLKISPSSERPSDTEQYVVTALSKASEDLHVECKQTLNIIYIDNKNTSIIRTGLQSRTEFYVDSPDEEIINLDYEFFGRNISYDVNLDVQNSSIHPRYYI